MAEPKKKSMNVPALLRGVAAAIFVDPLAKIICIVLAVMLWMYIVGEAEVQFEFRDVAVEFIDVLPNLAVSDDSQRTLTLRVSGPKTAISTLAATDFKVNVSLAGKREGEKWIVLSLDNVVSPRADVKIERIDPGSLRVFLERLEGRRLPVTPRLDGEVPAGYVVKAVVRPESVMVLGPSSLFLRLQEISTDIIDIRGRTAPFSVQIKIQKDGRAVQKIDPENVTVDVEISESVIEKTIDGVRVELQNPIPGRTVQIKPEKVSIRLRGPQNIIDHIDATQLRAGVELPPDKQFHLTVPRALNIPDRAEVMSFDPAYVRVSIPGQ